MLGLLSYQTQNNLIEVKIFKSNPLDCDVIDILALAKDIGKCYLKSFFKITCSNSNEQIRHEHLSIHCGFSKAEFQISTPATKINTVSNFEENFI